MGQTLSLGNQNPHELVGTVSGGRSCFSIFTSYSVNSSIFPPLKAGIIIENTTKLSHQHSQEGFSLFIFSCFRCWFCLCVCSIDFNEMRVRFKFLKNILQDTTYSSNEVSNKCTLYQVLPVKIEGKIYLKIRSKNFPQSLGFHFRPRFYEPALTLPPRLLGFWLRNEDVVLMRVTTWACDCPLRGSWLLSGLRAALHVDGHRYIFLG